MWVRGNPRVDLFLTYNVSGCLFGESDECIGFQTTKWGERGGDAMCHSRHICIGPMASTHWRNLFLITICSTFPKYRTWILLLVQAWKQSPKFKPSMLLHKWDTEERQEKGDNNREKQAYKHKFGQALGAPPLKLGSLLCHARPSWTH